MADVVDFPTGGYRFIPSVFQYSAGVAAQPGHEIERLRFRAPVPLAAGFERIEAIIRESGRPLTSFCACELRSPAPFTEQGFLAFNETYVVTLRKWGLFDGTTNPVARSNVCPAIHPPAEPSFHAFSFTRAVAVGVRVMVGVAVPVGLGVGVGSTGGSPGVGLGLSTNGQPPSPRSFNDRRSRE